MTKFSATSTGVGRSNGTYGFEVCYTLQDYIQAQAGSNWKSADESLMRLLLLSSNSINEYA